MHPFHLNRIFLNCEKYKRKDSNQNAEILVKFPRNLNFCSIRDLKHPTRPIVVTLIIIIIIITAVAITPDKCCAKGSRDETKIQEFVYRDNKNVDGITLIFFLFSVIGSLIDTIFKSNVSKNYFSCFEISLIKISFFINRNITCAVILDCGVSLNL
jgi:hypothetical protein